ncbi:MAG: MFS transporter, partial [Candidatus Thorarchaeota archaeon]|nr:MFS transporter [Candidatus Thorarchaeota archaeon]
IATDWLTVIPMFIFFGLSAGALSPVQTTLVADLVEEERRASIIGAFQMILGITALPAGIIIGWLWESAGSLVAFNFSLILALIALILMMLIKIPKPGEAAN